MTLQVTPEHIPDLIARGLLSKPTTQTRVDWRAGHFEVGIYNNAYSQRDQGARIVEISAEFLGSKIACSCDEVADLDGDVFERYAKCAAWAKPSQSDKVNEALAKAITERIPKLSNHHRILIAGLVAS